MANLLREFVPEQIYENRDSQVFIELLGTIYSDMSDMIGQFPQLADVDNVQDIFLPKLSALIKYNYDYSIDIEAQREIIKRMLHVYRNRGTDDHIIMAATYGNDSNWIGDHLFVPGTKVPKDEAQIIYPVTKIFRHSVSVHSGSDKYTDSVRWRDGVIIIKLAFLNDQIRQAVKKVVPAGIKFYFDLSTDTSFGGEGDSEGAYGEVTFGEWVLDTNYEILYDIPIKDTSYTTAEFSSNMKRGSSNNLLSGREIVSMCVEVIREFQASMIPERYQQNKPIIVPPPIIGGDGDVEEVVGSFKKGIPKRSMSSALRGFGLGFSGGHVAEEDLPEYEESENNPNEVLNPIEYQIEDFEHRLHKRGIPCRSMLSSTRGNRIEISGTRTGEVSAMTEIYEVKPSDMMYSVAEVANQKIGYILRNYNPGFEVNILK